MTRNATVRVLIGFVFSGMLLIACNKTSTPKGETASAPSGNLFGVWVLSAEDGGIGGIAQLPLGNEPTLEFSFFNKVIARSSGSTVSGVYHLSGPPSPDGKQLLILQYDGSSAAEADSVLVKGDQLSLFILPEPGCCDMIDTYIYTREN